MYNSSELDEKDSKLCNLVKSLEDGACTLQETCIQDSISWQLNDISRSAIARDDYLQSLMDRNAHLKNDISNLKCKALELEENLSRLQETCNSNTNNCNNDSCCTSESVATDKNQEKKSIPAASRAAAYANQIPSSISEDPDLIEAMRVLPSNYNFEIAKTVWRLRGAENPKCSRVALQFPEGLLMYSCIITDILERFVPGLETVIMGDVTYGACCIDDFTSNALNCDFLVHYGHSCLVPITVTQTRVLYVFVDIMINVNHLCHSIIYNFPMPNESIPMSLIENMNKYKQKKDNNNAIEFYPSSTHEIQSADSSKTKNNEMNSSEISHQSVAKPRRIILAGTIQFATAVSESKHILEEYYGKENVYVPQAKPLSPGEVLGCTSPILTFPKKHDQYQTKSNVLRKDKSCTLKLHEMQSHECDCKMEETDSKITSISEEKEVEDDEMETILVFVADGRFHLESIMIANPSLLTYRYNPYDNKLTFERYNHETMYSMRKSVINKAKKITYMQRNENSDSVNHVKWGIILGTLGRQGNPNILNRLCDIMDKKHIEYNIVLLSEIFNSKLLKFSEEIKVWIQIGCPRLSIDWGVDSFEMILLNAYEATVALNEIEWNDNSYPMDYYRADGGIWSNYYMTEAEKIEKEKKRKQRRLERRKQLLAQRKAKSTKSGHVTIKYEV